MKKLEDADAKLLALQLSKVGKMTHDESIGIFLDCVDAVADTLYGKGTRERDEFVALAQDGVDENLF